MPPTEKQCAASQKSIHQRVCLFLAINTNENRTRCCSDLLSAILGRKQLSPVELHSPPVRFVGPASGRGASEIAAPLSATLSLSPSFSLHQWKGNPLPPRLPFYRFLPVSLLLSPSTKRETWSLCRRSPYIPQPPPCWRPDEGDRRGGVERGAAS